MANIQVPRVADITGRKSRDELTADREWQAIQDRIDANRQAFASPHQRLSRGKLKRITSETRSR